MMEKGEEKLYLRTREKKTKCKMRPIEKINTALFILQYAFVQNVHVACRRLLKGKENPPS